MIYIAGMFDGADGAGLDTFVPLKSVEMKILLIV